MAYSAQPGSRPGRGYSLCRSFSSFTPRPWNADGLHLARSMRRVSRDMEAIARRGVFGSDQPSLPSSSRITGSPPGVGRVVPGSIPGGTTGMIPDHLRKEANACRSLESRIAPETCTRLVLPALSIFSRTACLSFSSETWLTASSSTLCVCM
jgi:hypothetical protein